MKKVVQQKQVVVAQAKADCEELLVEIVQDKRVADEQEKQVGGQGWRWQTFEAVAPVDCCHTAKTALL